MDSIREINNDVDIVKSKYMKSAVDIRRDFDDENSVKDDYMGRQIFELLQNADDCGMENDEDISVKFELADNLLIVKNTGTPFSARGITSLLNPNASSKYKGTIGNKGLGFRSVLNWTYEIRIITKEFDVGFSEKKARRELDFYKGLQGIAHPEELDKIDRLAILSMPDVKSPDNRAMEMLENYSTAILLYCDKDRLSDIQHQLDELQFEELLFLKHTKQIEIVSSGVNRIVKSDRNKIATKGYERVSISDTKDSTPSEWYVWRKSGRIDKNNPQSNLFELAIAYNRNKKVQTQISESSVLYSYFKTEIAMRFPFLVHGTFSLTSARDKLKKGDSNNNQLVNELIDFIAETSIQISRLEKVCDYSPLKCMLPAHPLNNGLDWDYHFSENLKSKIKELKIFPAINNEYIGLSDKPKYLKEYIEDDAGKKTYFADILNKKRFHLLLKPCNDDVILEYFYLNNIRRYDEDDFVSLIDKDADEYVRSNRHIDIIKLFDSEYYSSCDCTPHIMVDNKGNRITHDGVKIYNNSDISINELPEWADILFIDESIENKLESFFNESGACLADDLSKYGWAPYYIDEIVDDLVEQAGDDYDRVVDLLRWLYVYWLANENDFPEGPINNIKVITRDNEIAEAAECYIGAEYGFEHEEQITKYVKGASYVASNDVLVLAQNRNSADELKQVSEFLLRIGVSRFPRLKCGELSDKERHEYLDYNDGKYQRLDVSNSGYGGYFSTKEVKDWHTLEIFVANIECLENILSNADFYDILYWLLNDEKLFNCLSDDREPINLFPNDIQMRGVPNGLRSYRVLSNKQMRMWVRRQITVIPWLQTVSGNKASFSTCTVSNHDLSPILESLKIDYGLASRQYGLSKKKIEDLWRILGLASEFVDLPKEDIYRILNDLPTLDIDIQNSAERKRVESVYSGINQTYRSAPGEYNVDEVIKNNEAYDSFLEQGKILAKIDGRYEYLRVNRVYYVDKKIYSDEILKNYPVFPISRRSGNEKIQKLFGVKPIKKIKDIKIESVEHELNEKYRGEYRNQLPYIYAHRLKSAGKNTDARTLRDSNVILVKSARLTYTDEKQLKTVELSDYDLAISGKSAYIKIPESIKSVEELRTIPRYKSVISEAVTTFLDVESDAMTFSFIFSQSPQNNSQFFEMQEDGSLLESAKRAFSDLLDSKEEFWQTLAHAKGEDYKTLMKNYSVMVPADFDYKNINTRGNYSSIKNLFTALKINVSDYNGYAYDYIHLEKYNQELIDTIKNKYKSRYFSYKISELIQAGDKTAEDFTVLEREFYSFECLENTVYFDGVKKFEEKFNVSTKVLDGIKEDYRELLRRLPERQREKSDVSDALSNGDNSASPEKEIDAVNEFENIKGIEITIVSPNYFVGKSAADPVPKTPHTGTRRPMTYDRETNTTKENNGFKAESAVYISLCEEKDNGRISSVYWLSGNAQKAGKAIGEADDSLGYDIEYYDKDGKHYVEVKGTTTNNPEFTLSRNEYDFAQSHRENYEVWFVFIKEGEYKIVPIKKFLVFDEKQDFLHNEKYDVQYGSFTIRLNIDESDET